MNINLSTLDPAETYAMLTQLIVPRPVAWVITGNDSGNYNLAPFSYFNIVCARPPIVMLSIGVKPGGDAKDTRHNLEQRGHCVIHIAHREMAPLVTVTSATLDREVSELAETGLETVDMPGSDLPRLAACRVACAACLIDTKQIHQQWLAFLQLEHLYLDECLVSKDAKGRLKVMADRLDPIARLGGGEYLLAGDIIDIPRPQ